MSSAGAPRVAVSAGKIGPGAAFMRIEGSTKLYRGVKPHHAAVLCRAGRAEWWVDGRTGVQVPGSLQLKVPGQVHRDVRRDAPGAFELLSFDAELIDASREALGIPRHAQLATLQLAPGDPRAAPVLRLHRLAVARADPFTTESAIAEAAAAFASQLEDPRAGAGSERRLRWNVRRARDFLLEHVSERITLDALSAHARTDKFHLCRAFSAEVGLPPYAFLTHLRIARACVLLRRGVRASELAPQLGFCDQSQMHRHFVRIVGLTPSAYARQLIR